MQRRFGLNFGRFLEWITEDVSEQATTAEMRRRGAGEAYLIDRMHAAGMIVGDGR
ncbi:hypothetical protein SAMN02927900_05365 [Rhizobium mongolense subsp. loessense]|uniref:Uncharacterized protein n=1 Tax=Rhizobium mongolense subsp. loessense TaxID=158890 RepID=A0A1G4TPE1_9HYPH|nr:hypothetical protein [Rhizobium mongolense]SCW82635.1 hypothetical protein SAMN02927900_05365 [Rhizobium mongolense subsp. loessense]